MQLQSTCLGHLPEMSSRIVQVWASLHDSHQKCPLGFYEQDRYRKYRSVLRSLWNLTPHYLTGACKRASLSDTVPPFPVPVPLPLPQRL
jgi:hypothetical protein